MEPGTDAIKPGTIAIVRDTAIGSTHVGLCKEITWWSSNGKQVKRVWVVFGREIDYYPEEIEVLEVIPGIEEKRKEWERQ